MAKEDFKRFVRSHPELIDYVNSGEMNWQKFYELYDLYGEDNSIWNEYLHERENVKKSLQTNNTINDFMNLIKKVDLDNLQESISSVQRVVGVISDLVLKNDNETNVNEYKPRPLYKHFDD